MYPVHASDPRFDPARSPKRVITRRILQHGRMAYAADRIARSLVLVLRDELLVLKPACPEEWYAGLELQLNEIATLCGSLRGAAPALLPPDADDVQVWRLNDPEAGDSIAQARRLRAGVPPPRTVAIPGLGAVPVPPVSPHHICVVSKYDTCPYGPPRPHRPPQPGDAAFVEPFDPAGPVDVVVVDSGYIANGDLQHRGHLRDEPGKWLDTRTSSWVDESPDELDANGDGKLDGVAGHGTFVAGIVAARCRRANITIVGHRHACMPISPTDGVDRTKLFTSEIAIALSVLVHRDAPVTCCVFSFPPLDGLASIPFSVVLPTLPPGTAIVAPAGNEETAAPYWPAAHPRVIGVAATNAAGTRKTSWSNWGTWADCCAPGERVLSTFVTFSGPTEDSWPPPRGAPFDFTGWATWSGTSFATPKVAAAIARVSAERAIAPAAAYRELVKGNVHSVPVDRQFAPQAGSFAAGVRLPRLQLP